MSALNVTNGGAGATGNSGVTAGTYGNATNVAQITVSANGSISSAANVSITGTVASFKTTAITITAAGAFNQSHGLTGVTDISDVIVGAYLKNVSTEGNYTANQVVPVNAAQQSTVLENGKGISIMANSTVLTGRFGSAASGFTILDATSGGSVDITDNKWSLIVTLRKPSA